MDSIRDFEKISFREIEQAAFRIACKTQIRAMGCGNLLADTEKMDDNK